MNYSLTLTAAPSLKFKCHPISALKLFYIASFVVILSLLILFIFQINNLVFQGYLVKNSEKDIENFAKENENLEMNLAAMASLENAEKITGELGFEKIKKIHYIQILENSVASA